MLLCASREGRRRSIRPTHKKPRSSNTARGPWPVFPESSRSGRRTNCLRWSRPLGVCLPSVWVSRLRGFCVKALPRVCEPSVVLDLCVITRERQVLSSNRCVVSGRARDCGKADAGVMRRRAAVASASAGAMERPRRHWCHGCRSDGVLWLQVGVPRRSCTHAAAAMRTSKDRL